MNEDGEKMRGDHVRVLLASFVLLSGIVGTGAWSQTVGLRTSLNAPQIIAIQNELSAELNRVAAKSFPSNVAKDLALQSSIAQVTQNEIRMNGRETAGSVASAIIAIALRKNASSSAIGAALGNVAVQISSCKTSGDPACDSAKAIAQTVANEGTSVMVDSFVSAATLAGGSTELAFVALGVPQVTAAIPGSVRGHIYGNLAPPPPPPPCANPSCT